MPLTESEHQDIINRYAADLHDTYPNGVKFSADLQQILVDDLQKTYGVEISRADRNIIAQAIINQLAAEAEPAEV